MQIPDGIAQVQLSEEQIRQRVEQLAAQVSADYRDEDELMLVCVLKGAFIFMADLSRQLTVSHHVDFIALSSYEAGTVRGSVRLIMDTRADLAGRHVLIVEDILDSGNTLSYLQRNFAAREPASLRTCVLLRKPHDEASDVQVNYLGFDIPKEAWVVGYGLDFADKYRTLPYIGVIKDHLKNLP